MKLKLETPVASSYKKVFERFDISLFEALKPPFINLTIDRFDGCSKGDEVHLQVGVGPLKQTWVSHITDSGETEDSLYFVDEGHVLPPPLKYWRHQHIIKKIDDLSSVIIDDIEYSSGNQLLDRALYPVLYVQFALRGPIYKDTFGHVN
jgi:ligand-binding SRPBCC domain-containing protein